MVARTIGAITLGLDSSQQLWYWFMSLSTERRIHRRNWAPSPMPDEVVLRVEQLGEKDGHPNLLVFTDKHGENLLDDYLDDDDLSSATELDADEICGVDSDLSKMSDIPDKNLPSPDAEIQKAVIRQ